MTNAKLETDDKPKTDNISSSAGSTPKPIPPELVIETRHALPDGTAYLATAATLHLKNADGDPIGEVFHTIYTRGERPDVKRPLLFAFTPLHMTA